MAFFIRGNKISAPTIGGLSLDFLHKAGCQACPLNRVEINKNPSMPPSGTDRPIVYMLGEAPGKTEDAEGEPFVGDAGDVLRSEIPGDWLPYIRMNNVVRTRPPKNRDPAPIEIECCRPSIVRDIEETQPRAIFGLGNVALNWMTKQSGIQKWRGRRMPVKVGSHVCWFFPMLHPSYLLHMQNNFGDFAAEPYEFAFALDLRRAFACVESLPDPVVHSRDDALSGLEVYTGHDTNDFDNVIDAIEAMYGEDIVGIDLETGTDKISCTRPYTEGARILSVALSSAKRTFSFALDHPNAGWLPSKRDIVFNAFDDFLIHAKGRKISFALPFEMEWCSYFFGRDCIYTPWGDAQSQAYILDERKGVLSLDSICLIHFGLDLKAISNVDRKNLPTTPVQDVCQYNALDAKYHRLAWLVQDKLLIEHGLVETYEYQQARVPAAVQAQLEGIPIDADVVQKNAEKWEDMLDDIEARISASYEAKLFSKLIEHEFRPSSQYDAEIMFRRVLNLPIENTQAETLEKLDHSFAKLVIEWREANKTYSTYITPCLPDSKNSVLFPDGRLHVAYNLTDTSTWRTSAKDTNIQNWPKRDANVKAQIRKQVRPGGGLRVVSFDYGQIQARNVGMESLDKALIKAFWDRYDIHADWVERIMREYPRWIKEGEKKLANEKKLFKSYRDRAKNEFVFPSFFGAQPYSISQNLGIPEDITKYLQDDFWGMFPGVRDWQERVKRDYKENGYVTGLSGFRRQAPVSLNEIINAPIQGDEAIIVTNAWARLSALGDPRFIAPLEVHDDLTLIWPKHEIERNAETVIEHMINVPFKWAQVVPIVVEMSVGEDWGSVEEIGVFSSDTWKGQLQQTELDKLEPFAGNWSDGTTWDNYGMIKNVRRNKAASQGKRLG